MIGFLYFVLFLIGGVFIVRFQLPRRKPLVRIVLGLALGVFLLMWLPVLFAYILTFNLLAHLLSLVVLALLVGLSYLFKDKHRPAPFDEEQWIWLKRALIMVVPLCIVSGFLQYTHCLRLASDGSYHVGQSTYGDLSLHLAVVTSIPNASFPLHNSLMYGATMAYPHLSDSIASSLLLFNVSLPTAMVFTGTLMMFVVYSSYALICLSLCKKRGAALLAFFLLFFNGGLGFLYTLSPQIASSQITTIADQLNLALHGFYKTPTNQPDPYNLRWVNLVCDMLIPQRGILGGFSILLPCFLLLLPPMVANKKLQTREVILLGVFAGGLPLIHTHSYLALALSSLGFMAYQLINAEKSKRLSLFNSWFLFGAITCCLSLPQLFTFTFQQAGSSDHFLRFQFNWCNNRGGQGLVDPYFWFYIKNIGIPYLLIILALCKRKKSTTDLATLHQHRIIACGAFLIYIVAEFIIFQPNEYDNNKLFYVWFLLCLPMAADYAMLLFEKIKGVPGRRLIATLFLVTCFLSSSITFARELVSDYEVYDANDIKTAQWVKENTPEHSVFLTGNQHLNPISSLAGRTILCSSEIYLYYHGFNTSERRSEVKRMYEQPYENIDLFSDYGVQYIYISDFESSSDWFYINEEEISTLFPLVYENDTQRIYMIEEAIP